MISVFIPILGCVQKRYDKYIRKEHFLGESVKRKKKTGGL